MQRSFQQVQQEELFTVVLAEIDSTFLVYPQDDFVVQDNGGSTVPVDPEFVARTEILAHLSREPGGGPVPEKLCRALKGDQFADTLGTFFRWPGS